MKLLGKMPWAETWSDGRFKLLGLAELLGGVGVIVPHVTGVLPVLTPVAAVSLVVLMAGAVKTHLDRKESPAAPAVLAVLGVFGALGRFGVF
ncbi:MAG: DoxX family protein [Kofleriaceae bacterium]